MTAISRLVALGAFVGLAGCGLPGTFHVDSFLDQEVSGSDFNAWLAKEYQARTKFEATKEVEWRHAGRLASKGWAALHGETPLPDDPAAWNVASGDLAELQSYRQRLVAALDAGGRQERPEFCAKAQVYYDGWLEQSHDNDFGPGFVGPVQPDNVAKEKAQFLEILPKCEGLIKPLTFTIYFGWDRHDLTAAATAVLDEIGAFVKDLGMKPNVDVEGHADTSGSAKYNVGLSKKRADVVAKGLGERGVSATATSWKGETELAVPTADGVREPLNRRTEVVLSRP